VKKAPDDWGSPLGADPDRKETPAPKRGTLPALVYYFRDRLPEEAMDRIGAPVNAKALMVGFKKLIERGFTHEDIRAMIDTFVQDIARRPLPSHVAAWRGFLANMDKYAKDGKIREDDSRPPERQIDPRLLAE
jgi:hypothetical protein